VRGLPTKVRQLVEKARDAATMAIDVYNRPATTFRSPAYIVLMVIAWVALFHAIFERRKVAYYYRKRNSRRFELIDGDRKAWDLSKCLQEYYGDNQPGTRKNLEFFIGLRNKVEHRFIPEIDLEIVGECQAMLLNFEELLVSSFGQRYAIASDLIFPLQLSQVRPAARAIALRRAQAREFVRIKQYIDGFRGSLDESFWKTNEYAFRVYLVPKLGNRPSTSDLAVEFVRFDEKNPEEMEQYTRAVALIKEKQVSVANLGLLRAGEVVEGVRDRIHRVFSHHQHGQCWRFYHVRPSTGDPNPRSCDNRYCFYDSAHRDYLYTPAWLEHLVKELSDANQYGEVCPRKLAPRNS